MNYLLSDSWLISFLVLLYAVILMGCLALNATNIYTREMEERTLGKPSTGCRYGEAVFALLIVVIAGIALVLTLIEDRYDDAQGAPVVAASNSRTGEH